MERRETQEYPTRLLLFRTLSRKIIFKMIRNRPGFRLTEQGRDDLRFLTSIKKNLLFIFLSDTLTHMRKCYGSHISLGGGGGTPLDPAKEIK